MSNDCILLTRKPKPTLNITSTTCCQSSSKIPVICCQISSYSNKTEILATRYGRHRNGLRKIVLTSSVRTNSHLTLQTLTPWTIIFRVPHKYQQLSPKPVNKEQLKHALQIIWDELLQDSINEAALAFRKRLRACGWKAFRKLPLLAIT